MTLYQFNQLDVLEQWQVLDELEPVASRIDENNWYDLFAVDSFYVEVSYRMPEDIRKGLKSFSAVAKLLEPYLDEIDISRLV